MTSHPWRSLSSRTGENPAEALLVPQLSSVDRQPSLILALSEKPLVWEAGVRVTEDLNKCLECRVKCSLQVLLPNIHVLRKRHFVHHSIKHRPRAGTMSGSVADTNINIGCQPGMYTNEVLSSGGQKYVYFS